MNTQTNPKPKIKLDGYSKQKLSRAYMSLYNALVAEYQAQNMTLGKSWYNALTRMHEILKSQKTDVPNTALDYLMNFYNTHRQTQSKKMMIAKDKDLKIETNPDAVKNATDRVESELKHFQEAVQSVTTANVLVTLSTPTQKILTTFYDWADNQPNEINIDLDTNPREFERVYRKYIFQQKRR